MTIIVWDGTTLAADTLAVNGARKSYMTKIWKLDADTLMGGSGTAREIQSFMDWFKGDRDKSTYPYAKREQDESTILVVYRKGGVVGFAGYENSPYPTLFREKTYVCGSGAEVAVGAMEAGATAEQAVAAAIARNVYCGGEIDVLRFDD